MKYYRFVIASYAIACVYAAGCSGGSTPIEVEGPGPGADEAPVASPGGGNTPPVSGTGSSGNGSSGNGSSGNGSSGTGSGGTSSSSSGSGICTTCSDLLAGDASGTYCPGSDTLYIAFGMCACSSCSAECTGLCESSLPPSALCLQCAACATQISDCQADQ